MNGIHKLAHLLLGAGLCFLPIHSFSASNVDVAEIEIPLELLADSSADSIRLVTATVKNAASPNQAMSTILNQLTPTQLANTVVASEDPKVLDELLKRPDIQTTRHLGLGTAFFPLGKLASDKKLYQKLKALPIARAWNEARKLNASFSNSSFVKAAKERAQFLNNKDNRVDAVYFTTITGLVTRGWLWVRASGATPAHVNATLGTVSNLAFYQGMRLLYSIVPNKFAQTTAFTTQQLRKLFGQNLSTPASQVWKFAGNATTQAVINTVSAALNALNPTERFFSNQNLLPIFLNTLTGTVADVFVQNTYTKFGALKSSSTETNYFMTDLFLRRLGMVSGVLASYYAPTAELQKGIVRAWIAQGVELALWAYVAWDFERISQTVENGKIIKGYYHFEKFLTQTTLKFIKDEFLDSNCITLFGN